MSTGPAPIGAKFDWMGRVVSAALKDTRGLTEFEAVFAAQASLRLRQSYDGALFTAKEMGIAKRIGRKLEVAL